MKDKKAFGSFIKEKRMEKNYSQKDLAQLLYVTESAVSKWERGVTYPDITLITDICRVLGITEHELIESSHDEEYRKIKNDSIKYTRLKKVLFWTLNICYLTSLLVCFIVNLAVNHTLSWFFIVITSILIAYSFCPTFTWLVPKFKKEVFIGTTFISIFMLLLTLSIYTNDYWFMIPTLSLLLAYFIIFYPILFTIQRKYLHPDDYKQLSKWFSLTYIGGILILICLLLISIYCYNPFNLLLGLVITVGLFTIPLAICIIMLFDFGQKHKKTIILSFVGVLVLMLILELGFSFYLYTTKVTNTYLIEENYNNICIDVNTQDINFYLSDNNENKIICVENKKVSIETKVEGGTLYITHVDNRKFYERFTFNIKNDEIDVYLSKNIIDSLEIECSTADIKINNGFTFNNVKINTSTGDIEFISNVTNDLNIKVSTGDVSIGNSIVGGKVSIIGSSSNVEVLNSTFNALDVNIGNKLLLKNVIVTTDFNMIGSTGDLIFDSFDANNIYVSVSTGDVYGTILTSKFFVANSSTGNVRVPETREGGYCKITTSTGDIEIKYVS